MSVSGKVGAVDAFNHKRHLQFYDFIQELFVMNRYSLCKYCCYNKQCYYCHYPARAYNYVCDGVSITKFMDKFLSFRCEEDFRQGKVDELYDPLRDLSPDDPEWKRLCAIWEHIRKPEYKDVDFSFTTYEDS